jgi:hypothetical protein
MLDAKLKPSASVILSATFGVADAKRLTSHFHAQPNKNHFG